MKLLIVTQKVDINDDVLGFFHDWIAEFSKNCEKVTVICLEKGEYDLPGNVKVYSLGKEKRSKVETRRGASVISRLQYLFRFYNLIWKNRKEYDKVFVHMIPMYANIGAPIWRILKKKIALWYAHGHVSLALRLAESLVDDVFTSTKEGCRISSKKIQVVGQGIDTAKFKNRKLKVENDRFNIITIGRIAPVKDYKTLIKAIDILVNGKGCKNIRVKIIGGTLLAEHKSYSDELKSFVVKKGLENYIKFTGSVAYNKITDYIQGADLMASTSLTGSLDKVMLEAMSSGIPVVTCNKAIEESLGKYKNDLMYKTGAYMVLVDRIKWIMDLDDTKRNSLKTDLRGVVIKGHGIIRLIRKILNNTNSVYEKTK